METAFNVYLVTYTIGNMLLALMMLASQVFLLKPMKERCETVLNFVKAGDNERAWRFVSDKKKPDVYDIKALRILLAERGAPHRIPLAYDEAVVSLGAFARADAIPNIVRAVGTVALLILLYHYGSPGYFLEACVGISIACNTYTQHVSSKYVNTTHDLKLYLIQVRNELLAKQNYIPPFLRVTEVTQETITEWRRVMVEVERDVMLGLSPEESSNAAVKKIEKYLEKCTYTTDGIPLVRPPASRAGLLLNNE